MLRDGKPEPIEPLTPGGTVDFGDAVGSAETIFTLHSELATFGESFGCASATFRLSLTPTLRDRLQALVGAPAEEVEAASRQARPQSNQTVSVHVVAVTAQDGAECVVRSVTRPHFGLGGSIVSTASPAAAAVRLLARGSLSARGVHPPERCIEPDEMFAELALRSAAISVQG